MYFTSRLSWRTRAIAALICAFVLTLSLMAEKPSRPSL